MKKIAVAVVQKNNEILLVRRRRKEGNLQWQFPSGEIESAESNEQACMREVFEETNVTCRTVKKFGERIHPDSHVEIHYWLCDYVSGEAIVKDDDELDQVQWCNPSTVGKLITSSLFQPIADYLDSLTNSKNNK
jgi:8-oxo-dGTP diphosphatase